MSAAAVGSAVGATAAGAQPNYNAEALQKHIDASVNAVHKAIMQYCIAERTKTPQVILESRLVILTGLKLKEVDAKAQKIFDRIGEGLDLVLKTPQIDAFVALKNTIINNLINRLKNECVPEAIQKEGNAKAIDEAGAKAAVDFLESFVAPEAHALRAKLEADHKDLLESL